MQLIHPTGMLIFRGSFQNYLGVNLPYIIYPIGPLGVHEGAREGKSTPPRGLPEAPAGPDHDHLHAHSVVPLLPRKPWNHQYSIGFTACRAGQQWQSTRVGWQCWPTRRGVLTLVGFPGRGLRVTSATRGWAPKWSWSGPAGALRSNKFPRGIGEIGRK